MAAPYYTVNGVDILPYIADGGLVIEENDLDADGSGRTLDGVMHRTRVATKDKHTVKCMPLSTTDANTVLGAISGSAFVSVRTNVHPKYGLFSGTMYNSSRTASVLRLDENGDAMWDNISFTLIGQ